MMRNKRAVGSRNLLWICWLLVGDILRVCQGGIYLFSLLLW